MMALPLKWMPAYSHGGAFTKGQPTVVVVHSTESDNNPGSAEALAGPNWFGGPKAGTSAHKVVDVDSICEGVKRTTVAWHAGPGGNVRGIAYEFCGKAGWSAAQWRAPAQMQMLRNAAPHIADDLRGMSAPARWLSLAQLGGGQRGMCTHNDIRLAFGGTTHSDPGPNFPYAELLQLVQAELNGTAGGFLMALSDAQQQEIYAWLRGSNPDIDTLTVLYRMLGDVPRAVWNDVFVTRGGEGQVSVIQELADAKTQAIAASGQIAGFQAALATVAAGRGVDLDAVRAAAQAGAEAALKGGVKVTVDVPGQAKA